MKSMAGQWPGTGITTLRFAFGALLMGGIVAWREGLAGFRATHLWLHFARGGALAVASTCFYLAIFVMPLAEATTIQFLSPMLVGVIAWAVLGERMSRAGVGATGGRLRRRADGPAAGQRHLRLDRPFAAVFGQWTGNTGRAEPARGGGPPACWPANS